MKAQQLQPDSGLSYVKESEPSKYNSQLSYEYCSINDLINDYYCKDLIDYELLNNLRCEISLNLSYRYTTIPKNIKLSEIVAKYINWAQSIEGFHYWLHIYQFLLTQNL